MFIDLIIISFLTKSEVFMYKKLRNEDFSIDYAWAESSKGLSFFNRVLTIGSVCLLFSFLSGFILTPIMMVILLISSYFRWVFSSESL